MKFSVHYEFNSATGYVMNTDPDHNVLYRKLLTFFRDNHIQYKFVNEHRFKGDYEADPAFWHVVHDTLYFYRTQDRNLFLLHFGELYSV